MITIKMYNEKWNIVIENEVWVFKDLKEMKENLDKILTIKDKFGRIKKEETWQNQQ